MADLLPRQREILRFLAEGEVIRYAEDGSYGWMSPSCRPLEDADIVALRAARLIETPPDVISDKGRAALSESA